MDTPALAAEILGKYDAFASVGVTPPIEEIVEDMQRLVAWAVELAMTGLEAVDEPK